MAEKRLRTDGGENPRKGGGEGVTKRPLLFSTVAGRAGSPPPPPPKKRHPTKKTHKPPPTKKEEKKRLYLLALHYGLREGVKSESGNTKKERKPLSLFGPRFPGRKKTEGFADLPQWEALMKK